LSCISESPEPFQEDYGAKNDNGGKNQVDALEEVHEHDASIGGEVFSDIIRLFPYITKFTFLHRNLSIQ
jgi:hypothetical protein